MSKHSRPRVPKQQDNVQDWRLGSASLNVGLGHTNAWVAFNGPCRPAANCKIGLAPWCWTEAHGVRALRSWPCKNWQFSTSLKFQLFTNPQFTALIEGQACIVVWCTRLNNPELCPQKIDKIKSGLGRIAKFHKPGSVKYLSFCLVLYIFYIK